MNILLFLCWGILSVLSVTTGDQGYSITSIIVGLWAFSRLSRGTEWIPVSEQPPGSMIPVEVITKNQDHLVGQFDLSGNFITVIVSEQSRPYVKYVDRFDVSLWRYSHCGVS